jgi:Protein of unknown function (DUF3562)
MASALSNVDSELIAELSGTERLSIEAISRDVDVPLIEVANLYKVERANLECDAKIRSFVPVIASRQVRIKLKQLLQTYSLNSSKH